tara:strand:- start:3849 stop:3983 length:135 start_codon:yes stop_codon:yes gene_type:complete
MSLLFKIDVYVALGVLLFVFIWFVHSDGCFNKPMWVSTDFCEER